MGESHDLTPEQLDALRACFDKMEEESLAAAQKRQREIEESGEEVRIGVAPLSIGQEAHDFARQLREMYHLWATREHLEVKEDGYVLVIRGPGATRLRGELGVALMCRFSPFDEQGRRHSSFAQVVVDGRTSKAKKRSYVLDPYTLVTDYETGIKVEDAPGVLRGQLDELLPVAPATEKDGGGNG